MGDERGLRQQGTQGPPNLIPACLDGQCPRSQMGDGCADHPAIWRGGHRPIGVVPSEAATMPTVRPNAVGAAMDPGGYQ
jgi:hypothetical protein